MIHSKCSAEVKPVVPPERAFELLENESGHNPSGQGLACDSAGTSPATTPPLVAVDFETYYHKTDYSVADLGAERYVEDSRFHCYLVGIVTGASSEYVGPPETAPWGWVSGSVAVSHNNSFDAAVFQQLQKTGAVPSDCHPVSWMDSADLAAFLRVPRDLKSAAIHLVGADLSKDYRDFANGRHWGDFSQEEQAQLKEACLADAHASLDITRMYQGQWPEKERQLSALSRLHAQRGIRVNAPACVAAISELRSQLSKIEDRIPWVAEGQAPTSRNAIIAYCNKVGLTPPENFRKDNPNYVEWEVVHSESHPCIAAVREWREVNGLLKRAESIHRRTRKDGRISAEFKYFGASTGRASGGKLNLHSLPNGERCGVDLRGLLIPEPGHWFIASDLAQIEPRVAATLQRDHELLRLIRSGVSVYEAYARTYRGWRGGKLKDEDPEGYAFAKLCVLSLGYGTGWKRVRAAALEAGLKMTEQEARHAVSEYREQQPRLVHHWNELEFLFQTHAGKPGPFELPLPSGRALKYFDVQYDFNDRQYKARVVRDGNLESFWGSKLYENAIQAIARDIFMPMLLAIENEGLRTVLHVHDEIVVECPQREIIGAWNKIVDIMTTPPTWLPDLPLAADAVIIEKFA